MDYDPVKDRLGRFFWKTPTRTRVFYRTLDAVFLRSWYVRRQLRETIEALPQDREVRVLDAGTGFGQYAYWLVRTFHNVTVDAVDVKRDYLDRAQRFLSATPHADRVRFFELDLTEPMTDEAGYDVFLSVDVMEHILDDRAVFRNAARVLRPGGTLIVNTPSDLGGSGVTEEGDESFIGEHVRDGYNAGEITEKLETAGLDRVDVRYAYGPIGSVAWRLLVKWPIQMLSASKLLTPLVTLYYVPAALIGLALNAVDLVTENTEGTGLVVTARRPDVVRTADDLS